MARTGSRLAPALAVVAAVALVAACAEPDLTVGVPNTTTTAPPTRVVESPDSGEAPAPVPDDGGETASPPEAAPDPAAEPPGPEESPAGGAEPPPPPAPPVQPAEGSEPPAPVEDPAASGQEPSEPPPPEPGAEVAGLTATTLRVAAIADVETGGVADGRSRSVHSAMRAWAEAVNAAGGLAGRRVEVVVLDAGLFGHEAVLAEACAGDFFALVGGDALLDDEGVELLADPACDLVDFPARVHSPRRAASPRTFQAVPVSNEAVNVGALRWVAERQPVRIRSTATFFVDLPVTVIAAERTAEAARGMGFELIYDPSVAITESFDPYVEDMAAAGVHHVLWDGDTHRLLDLLASLDAAGLTVGINCATACDSALFLEVAGETAAGVLMWSPFLPLREDAYSPELAVYRQWLAVVEPDATADLQGVAAWAAGRLFEEAVRRAIGAGTPAEDPEALSPTGVARAAAGIVNWHGHGLHGPSNPGTGDPSPCGVVMGASGGNLFRFHPVVPGTFDCAPENLFALQATAELGLESPPEPAASDASSEP
ncbi:MAG: ABC transporter substrate-binding protein [Acidimicrobiia bacterium]|nr:ABC transporter substrate-binding protein [Acidimicrobiia bacterium]